MTKKDIDRLKEAIDEFDKRDNYALKIEKGKYSLIDLGIIDSFGGIVVISTDNRRDIFELEKKITELIEEYCKDREHMSTVMSI
jgi:hypothetical protein